MDHNSSQDTFSDGCAGTMVNVVSALPADHRAAQLLNVQFQVLTGVSLSALLSLDGGYLGEALRQADRA